MKDITEAMHNAIVGNSTQSAELALQLLIHPITGYLMFEFVLIAPASAAAKTFASHPETISGGP